MLQPSCPSFFAKAMPAFFHIRTFLTFLPCEIFFLGGSFVSLRSRLMYHLLREAFGNLLSIVKLTSLYSQFHWDLAFIENFDICFILTGIWANYISIAFGSVQLLSRVQLFATPRTAARQASLSITNS